MHTPPRSPVSSVGLCTCCCKGTRTVMPVLIMASIVLLLGVIGEAAGGSQFAPLVGTSVASFFGVGSSGSVGNFAWGPGFATGLTGLLLCAVSVGLLAVDCCSPPVYDTAGPAFSSQTPQVVVVQPGGYGQQQQYGGQQQQQQQYGSQQQMSQGKSRY